MSLDEQTKGSTLAAVAKLLGVPDADALARLRVDSLRSRTHRELLEISRQLGLSGLSRLNKEALAARLYPVLLAQASVPADVKTNANANANANANGSGRGAEPDARISEAAHVPIKMSHKFEVGERGAGIQDQPRTIPWSYGQDRITAMAVDPDRLFVYWEVTDDGISHARAQLGPGGSGAWLELRVYDVTGRIFDGTNAHSYFDHKIERHDRQWFFVIGKPASQAIVEVGLKSMEGFFAKISRSGRVDFPPKEPHGWTDPEWMTVRTVTGIPDPAGSGPPAQGAGIADGGQKAQFDPLPLWQMRAPVDAAAHWADGGGGGRQERIEWDEVWTDGRAGFHEGHRTMVWESPSMVSSWEAGPFSYPVQIPPPSVETHHGEARVQRIAGRTHVVYGPWQVVIRGLGARFSREVLARWQVERTWATEEGTEVRGVKLVARPGGSSEFVGAGASGRSWRGASEERLGGASEVFHLGASERHLIGASELLHAGSSQWRARGASELRFLGGSEARLRGASERLIGGGASEGRLRSAAETAAETPAASATDSFGSLGYPALPGSPTNSGSQE